MIGRKQTETDAMRLGTAVHTAIENYLAKGEFPVLQPDDPDWRATRIARAGESYLGPLHLEVRNQRAEVEPPFSFPSGVIGPFPFSGKIDFRGWGSGPRIVDHKTSSDLNAPWHLDAEGMRRNLQLRLYAALGFPDDTPIVRIGHIYYLTKPPFGSRELHVDVTRAELDQTRIDAINTARRIESIADITDIERQNELPFRRVSCSKYGGCPHRAYCNDSPTNEKRKLEQLQVAVNAIRLPPPRTPAMPLFGRKPVDPTPATPTTAAAPVTIAPGQITPPDAPKPDATPPASVHAELTPGAGDPVAAFRKVLLENVGPGKSIGLDIAKASAGMLRLTGEKATEAIAAGVVAGWWVVADDVLTLTAGGFNPFAPAPAKPGRPADPEKASLLAKVETFVSTFGEDRVSGVAANLGIKKFRMAGSAKLGELLTALRELAEPVVPTAEESDATCLRDALRADNTREAFEADALFGILSKARGSTITDDRMESAVRFGIEAGWWTWHDESETLNLVLDIIDEQSPDGREVLRRADPNGVLLGIDRSDPTETRTAPGTGGGGSLPSDYVQTAPDPRTARLDAYREVLAGAVDVPESYVLVGCVPVGPAVLLTSVEVWLAEVLADIESRADDDFWRFNRLPAAVASAVKVGLRTGGLVLPGMLLIPARHPLESHLVPVLAAFGAIVIRAVV